MDKTTFQFLSIKHPDVLKELQTHEQNATAQVSVLAPVGKDKYIAALANAGNGMHIDKLVEAVHGIKPGTPLFLPNKKRTSTWLTQNSCDTVKKGVAGVIEKVNVINGEATPATYKLTPAALKTYEDSISTSAGEELENLTVGEGDVQGEGEEQTTPATTKKGGNKRQALNA